MKIYKYQSIQIYMQKNINVKNEEKVCEECKYIYEKL